MEEQLNQIKQEIIEKKQPEVIKTETTNDTIKTIESQMKNTLQ